MHCFSDGQLKAISVTKSVEAVFRVTDVDSSVDVFSITSPDIKLDFGTVSAGDT